MRKKVKSNRLSFYYDSKSDEIINQLGFVITWKPGNETQKLDFAV